MPRRFAILLLSVLFLLLGGLVLVRWLETQPPGTKPKEGAVRRTLPPPLPPAEPQERRYLLYFESPEDNRLHAEARDLKSGPEDLVLLRAVASAVLEGPYDSRLLRPFPEGWKLRAAFRMKNQLVVLDLAPPGAEKPAATPEASEPDSRQNWQTGAHEEWSAIQSLLVSVARNVPESERFVILVGGEPVDTLGGHIDLSHPLKPDLTSIVEEPAPTPPATPSPISTATPAEATPATPVASPTPARTPAAGARTTPSATAHAPKRTPSPAPSASPASAPRPTQSPSPVASPASPVP